VEEKQKNLIQNFVRKHLHLNFFDVHLKFVALALLYIYFLHGSAYVFALVCNVVPTFFRVVFVKNKKI
jgi:hypothetical protein